MEVDELKTGLYSLLNTSVLKEAILCQHKEDIAEWGSWEIPRLARLVAQNIGKEVERYLSDTLLRKSENKETAVKHVQEFIRSEEFRTLVENALPIDDKILEEIKVFSNNKRKEHPDTPLCESAILTPDGHSPQLGTQLRKELAGSDRADWLVSFIKLKGINEMMPDLRTFVSIPNPDGSPRLRIATTTYMGASDKKAIEKLLELPNTEIRMSYDTEHTRLHAKAYLFYRGTGFSTAYIGSANLSSQAMNFGLEWTAKITQYEMPYLWRRAKMAFDICWNDSLHFQPCTTADLDKIEKALATGRSSGLQNKVSSALYVIDVNPYTYQQVILDDIQKEREVGRHRHLVISATGTGKTMVAAFDYRAMARGGRPRLLYVVHRKDILYQAAAKFRSVLRDGGFGHIVTGDEPCPKDSNILFCTLQSWVSQGYNTLPPDHFAYVIIDEAHHAPADNYLKLLRHIKPAVDSGKTELIGLTATPDRMDGKDIRADFGGSFTHELNLCEAINNGHLSPFSYFGIPDDSVTYEHVNWCSRAQAESEIAKILESNEEHARGVFNQVLEHVADEANIRALGFCAGVKHAKFMSDFFNAKGIKAAFLTGTDSHDDRKDAVSRLAASGADRINVIFIADLFNEGVDIPCIDTILFLRPTDSLTVFMQQLGRGLRLHIGKESLLILDFISRHNDNFNLAARFRMLTTKADVSLEKQILHGMPFLPTGCSITLEQGTQERIFENLKAFTARLRGQRLKKEIEGLILRAGKHVTLADMMEQLELDNPIQIYKSGIPNCIEQVALNAAEESVLYDTKQIRNGLQRISLVDNSTTIDQWLMFLNTPAQTTNNQELLKYFMACLFKQSPSSKDVDEFWRDISERPGLKQDISELLEWRKRNILSTSVKTFSETGILQLHKSYSKDQIVQALNGNPAAVREGVWNNKKKNLDVFFVTIDKNDDTFSQTTMYADYAITSELFHWQSQNTTSVNSDMGKRYIHHREYGYTPVIFARPKRRNIDGLTTPYHFLGPVSHENHEGSKPISFVWKLSNPIPASIFEWAKQDVG